MRALRKMTEDLVDGPHRLLESMGDTLRFPTGPGLKPFYVTRDLGHIEDVCVRKRDSYQKGSILQWMKPVFGDSILVSEGEHWRKNRRLMAPAFVRRALQNYGEIMVRKTEEALERIEPGVPFSVNHWSMVLTLDIVLECLFGAELGDKAPLVEEALNEGMEFADNVVGRLIPEPLWMPSRAQRMRRSALAKLHPLVDAIIAERIQSGVEREDLLGLLLAARDEDGSRLPPEEVRDEVVTLLLAGHETTALNIAYLFMVLGWREDIQQALVDELDEVLGAEAPSVATLPKLTQNEAAWKESLRLYPPAAVFSRQAKEDTTMGEWNIPKGANVLIPVRSVHRDARWYPDPTSFQLERWTPEEEAKRPRLAFLPFGAGNRVCIGDQFAKMEARLITARVLQRFRMKTLIQGDPRFKLTITMRALDKIMVVFEARAPR